MVVLFFRHVDEILFTKAVHLELCCGSFYSTMRFAILEVQVAVLELAACSALLWLTEILIYFPGYSFEVHSCLYFLLEIICSALSKKKVDADHFKQYYGARQ